MEEKIEVLTNISEFDNNPPAKLSSPKKRRTIIIVVVLLIAFLIGITYVLFSILPIYNSQKAFVTAQLLEETYEYEAAIEKYKQVVEADVENYEKANEKVSELKWRVKVNKFVAKSVTALINEGFIKSCADTTGLSVDAALGKVSCKINGVGYIVSNSKQFFAEAFNTYSLSLGNDLGTYSNEYQDSATGLCITEYKPSTYVGWYANIGNELKQSTSNTLFNNAKSDTKSNDILEGLVQRYIDLYMSKKDITVFE